MGDFSEAEFMMEYLKFNHDNMSDNDIIDTKGDNILYIVLDCLEKANGLQINESKTSLMEYMTKQKRVRLRGIPPELTVVEKVEDRLEDKLISDSLYCRTLGMNLQNNLSCNAHLYTGRKAIIPAARKQLGMLFK